jgi:flagellar basal-body rod modification protein FlgD
MSLISHLNPIYSPSQSLAAAQTSGTVTGNLSVTGKDEFLKLLVAQLQNQDPLSPAKNEAFVAQLATFSSLEQLISINQNIQKLVTPAAI